MSRDVIMKCPGCGAIVHGRTGWLQNTFVCNNCHCEIDPAKDAFETISCANCGNTVMFDTRISGEQKCPICNKPLQDHFIKTTDVECPSCHTHQHVKYNQEKHTCLICGYEFDVQKAKVMKAAAETATPTVISVPEGNSNIIWKHPLTRFAFGSHVVVPEGYTGLIMRDGICSQPSQPGKYLLSDTIRNMKEQLEFAVLEQSAQVSVQILFVKKQIDKQYNWTGQKKTIIDISTGDPLGTIGFGGNVALEVIDAKKLAEFIGYDEISADDISASSNENVRGTKLYEKVRACCFESADDVLLSAVYSNGWSPKALNASKQHFQGMIRTKVDEKLFEIGLKTSLFSLLFVTFQEDESIILAGKVREFTEYNIKEICRIVEQLFDWEAPEIPLHMKDNQTLSATVIFAGSMKFRITDPEKFLSNSQVQYWVSTDVQEDEVKEYYAKQARLGSSIVLSDLMQQMVNDTDADIRDLNTYYRYIRENIKDHLSAYFAKDGIDLELFDMHQKSIKMSPALEVMTDGNMANSTERIKSGLRVDRMKIDTQEYKTVESIKVDTHAFDSDKRLKKAQIDSNERITMENIALNEDGLHTDIYSGMAQNYTRRAGIDNQVQNTLKDIDRENKLRERNEYRIDEVDQINYLHHLEDSEKDWHRDQARKTGAYIHETKMTDASYSHEFDMAGYTHAAESSAMASSLELQKINQTTMARDAQHEQNQRTIYAKTEESQALHYLNQQEIENNAHEMRMEWEANRKIQEEKLIHQIKLNRMQWEENLTRERERTYQNNDLEQASAENDQMVNEIMIKIAESNLGLQQKKDAYARLLANQDADDHLRHTVEQANANIDMTYASEHLKNILTREEMDYMTSMAERIANFNDKMTDHKTARDEAMKNADYLRDMQRREVDTAHELEIMNLCFERDERQAAREHELQLKDIEINELKARLSHYEKMGEQDIQKMDLQTRADTTRQTAKLGAWENVQKTRYNAFADMYQAEKRYEAEGKKAKYDALGKKAEYEYNYKIENARAERQYQENREKACQEAEKSFLETRMKMESEYMASADRLMSQLLAIQKTIRWKEGENKHLEIDRNADVQIEWAKAYVQQVNDEQKQNIASIMSQTEKMFKQMQSIKTELENVKNNQNQGFYPNYNVNGNNNQKYNTGHYNTSFNYGGPPHVPPVSGGPVNNGMPVNTLNTKKCSACGKLLIPGVSVCSCGTPCS